MSGLFGKQTNASPRLSGSVALGAPMSAATLVLLIGVIVVVVAIVATVAAAFAARKGSATPPRPRPAAIHAAALPAAVIEAVSLKSGDVVESAASISATQPGKKPPGPSRRRRRRPVKRRIRSDARQGRGGQQASGGGICVGPPARAETHRELELLRKQADQQARQAEAARGESARADAVAATAAPPEKASERRPPSAAEQKTAQAVAEAPRVSSPPEPASSLNHPRHPRLARPRRGKRPSFRPPPPYATRPSSSGLSGTRAGIDDTPRLAVRKFEVATEGRLSRSGFISRSGRHASHGAAPDCSSRNSANRRHRAKFAGPQQKMRPSRTGQKLGRDFMNDLFRKEAVLHATRRLSGSVMLATPTSVQILGSFFGVIVVVAVIFASLATYARKATVMGWLVPDQGLIRATAPSAGFIRTLSIKEGDEVEKGARLAELQVGAETKNGDVGDNILAQLRAESDAAAAKARAQTERLEAELAQDGKKMKKLHLELDQLRNQAELQAKRVELAQNEAVRGDAVAAKGLLPLRERDARRSAALASIQELQSMRRQIAASESDLSDVEARISAIRSKGGRRRRDTGGAGDAPATPDRRRIAPRAGRRFPGRRANRRFARRRRPAGQDRRDRRRGRAQGRRARRRAPGALARRGVHPRRAGDAPHAAGLSA